MTESVETLAAVVKGTIHGDRARAIDDANAIEAAGSSAVTFVMNSSQVSRLKDCRAGAVIMEANVAALLTGPVGFSMIIVEDAQAAFQKILPLFRKVRQRPERSVSPHSHIHPTARLGSNCHVAAGVVIGEDAVIGSDCDLHPGVVVGAGCRIANDTVLHANVVLYHDVVDYCKPILSVILRWTCSYLVLGNRGIQSC